MSQNKDPLALMGAVRMAESIFYKIFRNYSRQTKHHSSILNMENGDREAGTETPQFQEISTFMSKYFTCCKTDEADPALLGPLAGFNHKHIPEGIHSTLQHHFSLFTHLHLWLKPFYLRAN